MNPRSPIFNSIDLLTLDRNEPANATVAEPIKVESREPSTTMPVAETNTRTRTSLPSEPAPIQSAVVSSLSSIKNQALDIQSKLNTLSQPKPQSRADQFAGAVLDLANEDLTDEKQQLRDDAGVAEKEEFTRDLFNRITERDNSYRDRIEALEKNPEGKLRGALNAEINDTQVQRSRELADLSFSYNIALGDLNAARNIVDARIQDMEAERTRKMTAYQTAYNFIQNDLSESEQLAINQKFQSDMKALDFEQQKEMTFLNDRLARERQAISDSRADRRAGAVAEQESAAAQVEAIKKADAIAANANKQVDAIDRILGNELGIGAITGNVRNSFLESLASPSILNPVSLVNRTLGTRTQKADVLNDLSLLANSAAFQSLADFRQQGVTFGQLSNSEREAAGAAANALVASLETDADGNYTGLRAGSSEESFTRNLNTVREALGSVKEDAYIEAYLSPAEQLDALLILNQ